YLVHHNAQDPHLIRLHMVLSAESTFPDHPAHEHYAARPSEVWSLYSGTRWRLPPQVGTFEDVHDLVELALAAMDGMQIRMFREPPLDLETQWARAEKVLFPSRSGTDSAETPGRHPALSAAQCSGRDVQPVAVQGMVRRLAAGEPAELAERALGHAVQLIALRAGDMGGELDGGHVPQR